MSNILKQSVLGSATSCQFKVEMQSCGFGTKKSKFAIVKPLLIELLGIELTKWDEDLINELADEVIDEKAYALPIQRELNLNEFTKCVLRMRDYFLKEGLTVKKVGYEATIDLNNVLGLTLKDSELKVKVDAILEDKRGRVYFMKFSRESYYLKNFRSKEGREWKFFDYSMEMYFLALVAEDYKKLHGVETHVGHLFLKNKKDKFSDEDEMADFVVGSNQNLGVNSSTEFVNNGWLKERLVEVLTEESEPCSKEACDKCIYNEICNYEHVTPKLPQKRAEAQSKSSGTVKWTEEQQTFINFDTGICRTNAVAGAGKTSVIANRFIELLKKGYLPETFLLITFTEKGCQELKEKIEYWLKVEGMDETIIEKIKVKTFNGFGNDLIKEHYSLLGYKEEPKLIDSVDTMNLIAELSQKHEPIPGLRYDNPLLHMFKARGAYFEIIELFEVIKKTGLYDILPAELVADEAKVPVEAVRLFVEFNKICKERGLIDYNDQILFANQLVGKKEVLDKLRLQHIIIDEVQDTNMSQMQIVKGLTTTPYFRSLVVCGDDSQSIYSFQGATQEIILRFDEIFSDVTDLTLSNNFRSTQEIAHLANKLNELNLYRIKKDIVAHKTGAKPAFLNAPSHDEIAKMIREEVSKGVPLNEIAIISRTRLPLRKIKDYLDTVGIPSTLACSEYLYENVAINRLVSLARWLKDNSQDLELVKFVQFSEHDEYEANNKSLEWLKQRTSDVRKEWLGLSSYKTLSKLLTVISETAKAYPSVAVLRDTLLKRHKMTLPELIDYLIGVVDSRSSLSLSAPTEEMGVVLTTAHSSKGREFHTVLILTDSFKSFAVPSLEEHFKTGAYDRFDLDASEEERRLMFVAITRAKEKLLIVKNQKFNSLQAEINYCMTGQDSGHIKYLNQYILTTTGKTLIA